MQSLYDFINTAEINVQSIGVGHTIPKFLVISNFKGSNTRLL